MSRFNGSVAIISPHLDDAIFSLGEFVQGRNVTIITPFAGVPTDPAGKRKYIILHNEHRQACEYLGIKPINGPFLDDVYPDLDVQEVEKWLKYALQGYDTVISPLGIVHKDHKILRLFYDLIIEDKIYYSDLPYATDYPEQCDELTKGLNKISLNNPDSTILPKEKAIKMYNSQAGGTVPNRVMQEELLWEK